MLKWRKVNISWTYEGDKRLVVAEAPSRHYQMEVDRPFGELGYYSWSAIPNGNTWENTQESSEKVFGSVEAAIKDAQDWLAKGILPMWGPDTYTLKPELPEA